VSRVALACVLAAGCFSKPPPPTDRGDAGSGDAHGPVIGRSWKQRANASQPGDSLAPKMAFDPMMGQVVMYGGDGAFADGMWELGETGWTSVCTGCPPQSVMGQGMVYDRKRGVIVMYGGFNTSVALDAVWEWSPTTRLWSQRSPMPAPPALQLLQMVYDEDAGNAFVIGGATDNPAMTAATATYRYDGSTWAAGSSGPLSMEAATVAVYDVAGHRTLLAGDTTPTTFADSVYQFDGTWSALCTSCSGDSRQDAAMVYDRAWGKALWIGGYSSMNGRISTVAQLDANGWTTISTDLPKREGWGVGYDEARDVIVLYGGWAGPSDPCGGPCDSSVCKCTETWEGLPIYGL
jgi:hypothetical protein